MTKSRRGLLAAGALFAVVWTVGVLGGCAAPAPKVVSVASGVTRVELGGVTMTTVSDGHGSRALDGGFVRNAPLAEVQAALREAGLPEDRLTIPYTVLLADIGSQRVLFDTGNGEFGAATAGKVLENMAKAGIDPASVTAVVISHFHGDHINGLRNKAGALVFPKAKIYVPTTEWNWWMDDARMAAAPEAMKNAFVATRRVFSPIASTVVRFEPGTEVLPGVRSIPAFGHTPGHTAFAIEGGSRKVMFWADNTNIAALFVRHPDWSAVFDMDADAARATRRKLADMAIDSDMLVAGYHLPGAAIGTLSRRGASYEFAPLAR